jgi:glycosyltransferase involved in cell wall biosynthesis
MDLVADMLVRELAARREDGLAVTQLRPRFVPRLTRVGVGAGNKHLFNGDRILNRFVDYPRFLRTRRDEFDLFHIVDHSYSHLVSLAGPERSLVTCHDLDTFRCILDPQSESRSWPFRKMTTRILRGLCTAAAVTCTTSVMRAEILRHRLVAPSRLVISPNGIAECFDSRPDPAVDREVCDLLGEPDSHTIEIVHVGSTIPRKRIDILLRVLAELRRELPCVRLVRVGGSFTAGQRELIKELDIPQDSMIVISHLPHTVLPGVYRRAALTLLTSQSEGFGIPVLESMACGTPVLASDTKVLREVGGTTTTYCTVADVPRWTAAIMDLLGERRECPQRWAERCAAGVKWAARFTWREYAGRAADLYRAIAAG